MGLLVERRPMGGKTLKGILWGRLGRPRWAKWGPPRAGASALAEPGMWDSPTLPGWQGRLPLGAYIRRGTPSLLIHQLIPDFSLDLVVPKSEPRRAEEEGISSSIARCRAAGVPVQVFRCSSWTGASEAVVSIVCVRLPARCCASGTRRPTSSTRPRGHLRRLCRAKFSAT